MTERDHSPLNSGEPEPDLALCGFGRIGPVDQVELRFQTEVTTNGSRCGLLHRVGAAGELSKRRYCSRPHHDRRDYRSRSDELQQRSEKWLAVMFGVVSPGQLFADGPELQRGD